MVRLPGAFDFQTLRRNWEALAREDPFWAVLTDPGKRGGKWDPGDFLASGRADVELSLAWVRGHAPAMRTRRALDFGCGAGRLTLALAEHFDEVVGVDIAPSMLAAARELDTTDGRCTWLLAEQPELPGLADQSFDLVYSSIVLQHMPPPILKRCLAELGRLTGDVLAVQVPHAPRIGLRASRSYLLRAIGSLRARARHRLARLRAGRRPAMEMHAVPRADVTAVLRGAGLDLLAVDEDDKAGPSWVSLRYCATRTRVES